MERCSLSSNWRARVGLILTCTFLWAEPLIVQLLGRRCGSDTGGGSDLLRAIAYAPIEAIHGLMALRVLLLLTWNGVFLVTVWRFAIRGEWHHRGAWLVLSVVSICLHAADCSHRSEDPLGIDIPVLDALLSPVTISRNAFFAPRLAWATLEWQRDGLKPWQWMLWLLFTLLMGIVLYQQDMRDWFFGLVCAWTLDTPRLVYKAGQRMYTGHRVADQTDQEVVVVGPASTDALDTTAELGGEDADSVE